MGMPDEIDEESLKKIVPKMCEFVLRVPIIPADRFIPAVEYGFSKDLLAKLTRDETLKYQQEFGIGICAGKEGYLLSGTICTGIRECDISKCDEPSAKRIGTFHTHPSSTPLPSGNDLVDIFLNTEKLPVKRLECIGGFITPGDARIVCIETAREYHGLREEQPRWNGHYSGMVEYFKNGEKEVEIYQIPADRKDDIEAGLKVLRHDPRFKVHEFNCQ